MSRGRSASWLGMQTGAVVMMDALGFKGIWRRVSSPETVVRKLRAMEQRARNLEKKDGTFTIHAVFLSDTIVFAVSRQETELPGVALALENATTLNLAAVFARRFIMEAVRDKPFLAYRGCIAFGEFHVDAPFLLGPAVDEAAEHHETADGAIIWLAPSARRVFKAFPLKDPVLTPWIVPLRSGAARRTHAVSPFEPLAASEQWAAIGERMLETFAQPADGATARSVRRKRQNTAAFLKHSLLQLWNPSKGRRVAPRQ
jgi:hypothetical protein